MSDDLENQSLRATLRAIQLRLSVLADHQLTQRDLARIAGVNLRSISEWMRGATSPASGMAILRLLSTLPDLDLRVVLDPWKECRSGAIGEDKENEVPRKRANARQKRVRQKIGV